MTQKLIFTIGDSFSEDKLARRLPAASSSGLAESGVEREKIHVSRSLMDFGLHSPELEHGDAERVRRALTISGLGQGDLYVRRMSGFGSMSDAQSRSLEEVRERLNKGGQELSPANALELSGWIDATLRVHHAARAPASSYESLYAELGWSLGAKTIGPVGVEPRESLLIYACWLGREDIVAMIARRVGLSASDRDKFGIDAMSKALRHRNSGCARELLANGFMVTRDHWPDAAGLLGTAEDSVADRGELLDCLAVLNEFGFDWGAFEEKTGAISAAASRQGERHVGAVKAWMEQQALARGLASKSAARGGAIRI